VSTTTPSATTPSAMTPRRRAARRATRSPARPGLDRRRVPHVVARSALADAAALVPPLDAARPVARPPRRLSVRRRLAALVAAGLVVAAAGVAFAGAHVVLARLTDAASVTGNSFATGSWAAATTWYLHNNPTPPTGNTAAQFNLALNATAPTATTLYNYDTGCDSRAGRSINRYTGLVTETGACRYATWRSAALSSARTLDGVATLTVWARKTSTLGVNPTLRVFLRVFDPATSTYVELGSASVTVTTESTSPWAAYTPTGLLASVTVPAGRQIEVKLVATGGTRNVEIAYDTTANPSALTLP
jgi:hypothetical protein